ncbi:hypothetical protein ACLKA6_017773 [Drosophila palustris]
MLSKKRPSACADKCTQTSSFNSHEHRVTFMVPDSDSNLPDLSFLPAIPLHRQMQQPQYETHNLKQVTNRKKIRWQTYKAKQKELKKALLSSVVSNSSDWRPYAEVSLLNKTLSGLMDTGASISCIGEYMEIKASVERNKSQLPDIKVLDNYVYRRSEHASGDAVADDLCWKLWIPVSMVPETCTFSTSATHTLKDLSSWDLKISRNEASNELEDLLQRFWELEQFDKESEDLSEEERWCEEFFVITHRRLPSGKYIVRLPFLTPLDSTMVLGESYRAALKRLCHLERLLRADDNLKEVYTATINEYLELGQMTPVKLSKDSYVRPEVVEGCYLPHHPVIKESSSTTKVRVVFDGSMKTSNGKALNDVLAIGPKLQLELPGVLMNWRALRFVFVADVEKMYRRINIHEDDAQYQRILWKSEEKADIDEYCCTTVMFGTSPAPFLAMRVMQQLASDEAENYPLTTDVVRYQMYVDEVLSGADSLSGAEAVQGQITEMLHKGTFELRKWASNCPQLLEKIPMEHPKMLMQRLWKEGLKWDDQVSASIQKAWTKFINDLPYITEIRIPRYLNFGGTYASGQLHIFCDASAKAYGAVAYLRVQTSDHTYRSEPGTVANSPDAGSLNAATDGQSYRRPHPTFTAVWGSALGAAKSQHKIFGYDLLLANHPGDRLRGGAAILVRSNISYCEHYRSEQAHFQSVAAMVTTDIGYHDIGYGCNLLPSCIGAFKSKLTSLLINDPPYALDTTNDIDIAAEDLVEKFHTAAAASMVNHRNVLPLGPPRAPLKPEILALLRRKRELRRRWMRTRHPLDQAEFKAATDVLRKALFEAKSEFFVEKLRAIDPNQNRGFALWKCTRGLKRQPLRRFSLLRNDGTWARSDLEIAEEFATDLSERFTPFDLASDEEVLATSSYAGVVPGPSVPIRQIDVPDQSSRS